MAVEKLGIRLLIVDDEVDLVECLSEFLSDFIQNIDIAYNCVQALDIIAERQFDIILSDIYLPGMRGEELLSHLRKRQIQTPVIFFTGDNSNELKTKISNLGASGIIEKPVSFDNLLQRIIDCLNKPIL